MWKITVPRCSWVETDPFFLFSVHTAVDIKCPHAALDKVHIVGSGEWAAMLGIVLLIKMNPFSFTYPV